MSSITAADYLRSQSVGAHPVRSVGIDEQIDSIPFLLDYTWRIQDAISFNLHRGRLLKIFPNVIFGIGRVVKSGAVASARLFFTISPATAYSNVMKPP